MLDYSAYVWRGHRREDWKLESTLFRLHRQTGISYSKASETRHLEQFKDASQGRRGRVPPALGSDNEWWALGQHHGLATPLLDWTASPFAAAFFAFAEDHPTDKTTHRVVYALHRTTIQNRARELQEEAAAQKAKEAEETKTGSMQNALALAIRDYKSEPALEVEFIKPRTDENQRLIVQNGLFSRMGSGRTSLESWIERKFSEDDNKTYTLLRCLIPDKDRGEALRVLDRMNLNHSTLFPDLTGASWHCNVSLALRGY